MGVIKTEVYRGMDTLRVGNGEGLSISRVGHAIIPDSKSLKPSNLLSLVF